MENVYNYSKDSFKNPSDLRKLIFNAGVESGLNYAEPITNVSHKIKLLFSPFGLPFIPLEIVGTDIGKVITSLSWTKDRNNPGGICGIQITPDSVTMSSLIDILNKISGNLYSKIWGKLGVEFEDLFKPMTLCQLWIDGYHIMTGTVRSCSRNSSVSNSDHPVSYTIAIDELGNLYNRNTLSLDTVLLDGMKTSILDSITKALESVANIRFIPLQTAINIYCKAWQASVLAEQGFSGSDGIPLSFRLLSTSNPIGGIANVAYAQGTTASVDMFKLSGGQSFWDFMKNIVPNPWMEFFTESGGRTIVTDPAGPPSILFPGFNYVVSRSTPYSNQMLGIVHPLNYIGIAPFDLTIIQMLFGGDFIIITDDMIQEKELGVDCSNQATIFRTKYTNGSSVISASREDKPIMSAGPLNPFASGGMGTFGATEMNQVINCLQLFEAGTTIETVANTAKDKISAIGILSKPALSNQLAVWFRNQSRFREGQVTTQMIPYARAGMYCLYLPSLSGKKPENLRDIGVYYIDSLSHNYSLTNEDISATTTLNLIRGVPLPTDMATAALLLFDFEVLPPMSGLTDGEFAILRALRAASTAV
jgi:hypothetical protein